MPDEASQIEEPEIEPNAASSEMADDADFVPATELGRRLLESRRWIIASGLRLATEAEFRCALAERRGGLADDPWYDSDTLRGDDALSHVDRQRGQFMARTAIPPTETTKATMDAQRPAPPENDAESPRTLLGARLTEIRKRIGASEQPLLDWDGIEREGAERRGGIADPTR
jgi:hypothetical protein